MWQMMVLAAEGKPCHSLTSRFAPSSVIRRRHVNNCKHGPGDDSFLFLIVFPPQSDILLANYLKKSKCFDKLLLLNSAQEVLQQP